MPGLLMWEADKCWELCDGVKRLVRWTGVSGSSCEVCVCQHQPDGPCEVEPSFLTSEVLEERDRASHSFSEW